VNASSFRAIKSILGKKRDQDMIEAAEKLALQQPYIFKYLFLYTAPGR
jgi:hypothetical protein